MPNKSSKITNIAISRGDIDEKHQIGFVLIDLMPFPVVIIDGKGTILFLNKKSERLFGNDLVGRKFNSAVCDDKAGCLKSLPKKILPRETRTYELSCTVKGNHVNVTEVGIEYDGKDAILMIFEDITEKKFSERKIDEVNTRLKSLMDNIDSGIIFTDENERVIYANRSFCTMFNIPAPELIIGTKCSQNLDVCKNISNPDFFVRLSKNKSKENGIVHEEFKLGKGKFIESIYCPIKSDDMFIGSFWYYDDISDEKKAELELKEQAMKLKEANKELTLAHKELKKEKSTVEKKVVQRTKSLNDANEKIKNLLEQKKSFINQIGHDLITPLTPIIGSLQLLSIKEKDNKNQQFIENALKNAQYLTRLLKDILSLSRLDSEMYKLNMQKANISGVVENIIDSHKVDLEEKNIKVEKEINHTPDIIIDVIKIEEVLGNIISNSYKFFGKEKPKLKFSVMSKEGEVIVSVEDNGIGIEQEALPKIFDEFFKADPSRHDMSTGLGLAICKKIISLHKGRIWAQSRGIGKGTQISFSLPLPNGGKKR